MPTTAVSRPPRPARATRALPPSNARAQAHVADGFEKLRPRTLVDQVIDALVAAAARGIILPGDRIVEGDLAAKLGVSRVPVREALRVLESQGVLVNEPYKGIRLRPVTAERIDQLIETRVALESSAASRAIRLGRNDAKHIAELEAIVDELVATSRRGDVYAFAAADADFHRALCRIGGNDVLSSLWEMLSRQTTIIFGLSALDKPMAEIVDEHRSLIEVFRSGDTDEMARAIDDHINVQTHAIDFPAVIERRRSLRTEGVDARIQETRHASRRASPIR